MSDDWDLVEAQEHAELERDKHTEIQIARIDIIIKELERGRNAAPGMMHSWFTGVIAEMEKLKDEEL